MAVYTKSGKIKLDGIARIVQGSLNDITPSIGLPPKKAVRMRETLRNHLRRSCEACDLPGLGKRIFVDSYDSRGCSRPETISYLIEAVQEVARDKRNRQISEELRGIAIQLEAMYWRKEERDYAGFKMPEDYY